MITRSQNTLPIIDLNELAAGTKAERNEGGKKGNSVPSLVIGHYSLSMPESLSSVYSDIH